MGLSSDPPARRPRTVALLASVLAACALIGCSREHPGSGILAAQRFDAQVLAELPLPGMAWAAPLPQEGVPTRIVSLIPSITELVFALGLGARQVGRSHWCDWPPEARALPDMGRLQAMSKEKIVDLRPDLVILFRTQADLARSLREDFGLRVFTPRTEEAGQVLAGMQAVASELGVPGRGRRLVAHIEHGLEAVRQRYAGSVKPRVLVTLDRSSWWVPGRSSFVHRLIETAGGINVAAGLDTQEAWPRVTWERILDWQPEVVLDLTIGGDIEASRREAADFWGARPQIPAVSSRRVHLISAGVLVRPGPRMAAVAAWLGEVLHE